MLCGEYCSSSGNLAWGEDELAACAVYDAHRTVGAKAAIEGVWTGKNGGKGSI
ncbi:MAG: hypothetical protein IT308_09430 [Anaerolineaceae bacterium]|nr:hypothetical protein [Anaerolineaceae bacterium]